MVGRVRKYTTPARTTARCARLFATRIVLGLRRPRGFHRRVELGINSALKTDAPDTVPPIVLRAIRNFRRRRWRYGFLCVSYLRFRGICPKCRAELKRQSIDCAILVPCAGFRIRRQDEAGYRIAGGIERGRGVLPCLA